VPSGVASPDGATADAAPQAWTTILSTEPDPALLRELAKPKWIRAAVIYSVIRVCGLIASVLLRFRVEDRDRLPRDGPCILCPNHQSYLDGFILAAGLPFQVFRRLFFVGATEYFETPLTAWLARSINIVPVDPDANLVSAMRAGAAGLRAGKVLMLFPEGERSIDGEIRPFRKGAAILASHLAAPLQPVAIDGLHALWPRGRGLAWRGFLPWRAVPVTVRFGAPQHVDNAMYTESTAVLQSAVATLLAGVRSARGRRPS
jgi:long-chain acyl-CoA synthetase